MPDIEKPCAKKINRAFLFNIMNTIDPNFFTKAVSEIEEAKFKDIVKVDRNVQINARMLLMLKEYCASHKTRAKRSSINLLRHVSRKRKSPKRRDLVEIKTEFGKRLH